MNRNNKDGDITPEILITLAVLGNMVRTYGTVYPAENPEARAVSRAQIMAQEGRKLVFVDPSSSETAVPVGNREEYFPTNQYGCYLSKKLNTGHRF